MHPRLEGKSLWDNGTVVPFETMQKEREVAAAKAEAETALAEAELEYPEDHISKSIYAAFEVSAPSAALAPLVEGAQVRVAIWTTTPWTIPANLAVAVNGKLSYAVVGHPALPYKLVVAEELVVLAHHLKRQRRVVEEASPNCRVSKSARRQARPQLRGQLDKLEVERCAAKGCSSIGHCVAVGPETRSARADPPHPTPTRELSGPKWLCVRHTYDNDYDRDRL